MSHSGAMQKCTHAASWRYAKAHAFCNLAFCKSRTHHSRFSEMKTPAMQIAVKTMNETRITFISTSAGTSASAMSEASTVTVIVTITMLNVCPIDLIVASIDEATP